MKRDRKIYVDVAGNASIGLRAGGKVVVRPRIVKQTIARPEGAISDGQRAELKRKVEEWVAVSELAGEPVSYGVAYTRLCRKAKSAGRSGVDQLIVFPACDFERGFEFIRAEIGKLRNTSKFVNNDPEAARKVMLAEIHKKKAQKKIPDERYREYLVVEFGVGSAAHLELGALQQLRDYLRNGGACLLPKPKEKSQQEIREDALRRLLAERGGMAFYSLDEAHAALIAVDRTLFSFGLDSFKQFWKLQKVTSLKRGRKTSSKESPVAYGVKV